MKKLLGVFLLMGLTASKSVSETGPLPNFSFNSIDGGLIHFDDFKDKVVLVINTASKCGFTGQYKGLQKLYHDFKNEGLVVFGVPSTDFRQEYKDSQSIQKFCELNFGINFPMSEVTNVIGKNAHPFYSWLSQEYNFTPRLNFNKVLLDKKGTFYASFNSFTKPNSPSLLKVVDEVLKQP